MKDRQPGKPGQYKATLLATEFQKMQEGKQFTITLVRDDQPIVPGTPYSAAAVLPDALAALICPNIDDPTPADAFRALLQDKAPSGYGLGTFGQSVASPDDAKMSGFYTAPAPGEIASAGYMRGLVMASSASYATQIWSMNGFLIKRELSNGVWGPYEWFNSPMLPGGEYRTAENHNGKNVYVQLLDCGNAAQLKTVTSKIALTGILRITGTVGAMPLAEGVENRGMSVSYSSGTVKINFATGTEFDGQPLSVTLWYTKD